MSFTRLRYHIVTATKHRDMIIGPDVEEILGPALQNKAQEHGAKLLAIGMVEDHIHLVAAIPPSIAVADFVRELKTASSRAVNKARLLDFRFEWQRGYGAFTLDSDNLGGILEYVKNQKAHHAEGTLQPRYERKH